MRNFAKTYFKIIEIVDLIFAILFAITIAGIIFAIPFYFAYKKFKAAGNMTDAQLIESKGSIMGWGIFNAIIFSPTIIFLIVELILVFMVNGFIDNLEQGKYKEAEKSFGETVKDGAKNAYEGTKDFFGIKDKNEKLAEDLSNLQTLKDNGILTEEEYNFKRQAIIDKSNEEKKLFKSKNDKLKEQLSQLQQLKDEGILTEEEYEYKRKKIIMDN